MRINPDLSSATKPVFGLSIGRLSLPGLRLRTSERRLLLITVDLLVINGALVAALAGLTDYPISWPFLWEVNKWFISLSILWFMVANFFDCYSLARSASLSAIARSSSQVVLMTILLYTLTPVVTPPLQNRSPLFLFAAIALAGIWVWRLCYARIFVQPWFRQRAVIVGAGAAGRTLVQAMRTTPGDPNPFRGTGYEFLGYVDDDPELIGRRIEGITVLGNRNNLVELVGQLAVDEVVLAITDRHAITQELFDALLRCQEMGVRVSTMPTLYARLLDRVPVEHLGRDLEMAIPVKESSIERIYLLVKRLMDIGGALVGLAALGVLAPLLALVKAFTSPGPLFYRQVRVGKGGKSFVMLKFRSMRPDAEAATGAVWAAQRDDRITPVGRLLRPIRMDELPQVINILRGEMSLIGPRPERPEFVEVLARQIPFYRARHCLPPGLTGWAQVRYRYGSSDVDARIKLEYDLYYIKYASLLLDLRILIHTAAVMLQRTGQ